MHPINATAPIRPSSSRSSSRTEGSDGTTARRWGRRGTRRVALAINVVLAMTGTTMVFALDGAAAPTWSGSVTSPTDTGVRLAPLAEADDAATRTITIDRDARFQTWIGTGATLTDASVALLAGNPGAQSLLVDDERADGLALDLLRLPLSATDFSTDWWTWDWNAKTGVATPSPEAVAAIDLTLQLDALGGGLDVVATPWTAPASMKTSRRLDGGALHRRSVGDYAEMLTAQTELLIAAGVPLTALTIANEPSHSGDYPTMTMTDTQLVDIATTIDAALEADGVKLWAVDHNWSDRDRVDNVLAGAPDAFDAAAFHCYGGSPDQMVGLRVPAIVTECTGTDDTWAGTFAWDARHLVVDAAVAGSTGLLMWNLALDPQHGPKAPGGCSDCRGLLTIDPARGTVEPTPEFYTLAHIGRAAPAGSVRLGATGPTDIPVVAFERLDGTVGVFGHNDTGTEQVVAVSIDGTTHRLVVPAGALFDAAGN